MQTTHFKTNIGPASTPRRKCVTVTNKQITLFRFKLVPQIGTFNQNLCTLFCARTTRNVIHRSIIRKVFFTWSIKSPTEIEYKKSNFLSE